MRRTDRDVGFGSKSAVSLPSRNVRFAPESGSVPRIEARQLGARSGLLQCNRTCGEEMFRTSFDHLVGASEQGRQQGPAPARLAQQYKPFISRGDPIENQSFVSS